MSLRDFRFVNRVGCSVTRIKIKKTHYRCLLMVAASGIWVVHANWPEYEMHATFAANLCFIFDPTI